MNETTEELKNEMEYIVLDGCVSRLEYELTLIAEQLETLQVLEEKYGAFFFSDAATEYFEETLRAEQKYIEQKRLAVTNELENYKVLREEQAKKL